MSIVVDCTSTPSTAALRAYETAGVCRYLSWLHLWGGKTHTGINPKIIQKPEFDRLIDADISVALNWEYDDHDWMGGASAGAAHAAEAIAQARALGYPPGCVIIGSCDFDMTSSQWASTGRAYAAAFTKGITAARYTAGVYGPYDVLGWCKALGGFGVFWQAGMSHGWSGGRNANRWPYAHLRQLRHQTIGGIDCDVNEILQPAYGQYQPWVAATPAVAPREESRMLTVVQERGSKDVWVGDGVTRSLLPAAALGGFEAWAVNHWPDGTVYTTLDAKKQPVVVQVVDPGSLDVFGRVASLVVAPSAADIAEAIVAHFTPKP
jgi:hypothetical protein